MSGCALVHVLRPVGTFLLPCLLIGCSSLGGASIHNSSRGTVYLQEIPDWSFEASHPVIIDRSTMLQIVKGLLADEPLTTSSKPPASGSKPMKVFSDEDAEFLAPLLARGLSQAKPEQIVGFTVSSSAGSGVAPTAGTLYVHEGAVHLTAGSANGKKLSGFAPSMAARREKPAYASAQLPGAVTMAIDYRALSKGGPASASMTAMSASAPEMDELQQARELNKQKDSEIALLRKEMAWMKQKLQVRTDELKALQAKKTSASPKTKKKTAEARPVH